MSPITSPIDPFGYIGCDIGKFIIKMHHNALSADNVDDLQYQSTNQLLCGWPDTSNPNAYGNCYFENMVGLTNTD